MSKENNKISLDKDMLQAVSYLILDSKDIKFLSRLTSQVKENNISYFIASLIFDLMDSNNIETFSRFIENNIELSDEDMTYFKSIGCLILKEGTTTLVVPDAIREYFNDRNQAILKFKLNRD